MSRQRAARSTLQPWSSTGLPGWSPMWQRSSTSFGHRTPRTPTTHTPCARWRSQANTSSLWFDGFVALDPVAPIRRVLLLPDGHRLLEPVDPPFARGDRLLAMRRRHGDHHRGLTDVEAAGAVHHRHARLGPPVGDLVGDLAHLRRGHL